MRRMIDAFAEYERLIIKARTLAAPAAKRRCGERTGRVPYGMTVIDDGRRSKKGNLPVALVPDAVEEAVVADIDALHAGGMSLLRHRPGRSTPAASRPSPASPAYPRPSPAPTTPGNRGPSRCLLPADPSADPCPTSCATSSRLAG